MITLLLYILQLFFLIVLIVFSIFFFILAIVGRKKKNTLVGLILLSFGLAIAAFYLWTTDLVAGETTDREEAIGAFEDNFGFKPPDSVKEINVKNYNIYDASAHWMAFTFDSLIFNRILKHEHPLDSVDIGTTKYDEINLLLRQSSANCPDWFRQPSSDTRKIFYKKQFMDADRSEYYLWVDSKQKMVFLEVFYYD